MAVPAAEPQKPAPPGPVAPQVRQAAASGSVESPPAFADAGGSRKRKGARAPLAPSEASSGPQAAQEGGSGRGRGRPVQQAQGRGEPTPVLPSAAKRRGAARVGVEQQQQPGSAAGAGKGRGAVAAAAEATLGVRGMVGSARKAVTINLKRNLYFDVGMTPLAPDVRTPPTARAKVGGGLGPNDVLWFATTVRDRPHPTGLQVY